MSDTMLLGVLRMPFDLAMATLTSRIQYHRRGVQAADEIEKLTRQRDEARAEMMEEAAKLVASWDEGGCECGGYGCSCGNFDDAVTAAVAATARGMANKLRARAETLRAKP
jgi:hypothetical protein